MFLHFARLYQVMETKHHNEETFRSKIEDLKRVKLGSNEKSRVLASITASNAPISLSYAQSLQVALREYRNLLARTLRRLLAL